MKVRRWWAENGSQPSPLEPHMERTIMGSVVNGQRQIIIRGFDLKAHQWVEVTLAEADIDRIVSINAATMNMKGISDG